MFLEKTFFCIQIDLSLDTDFWDVRGLGGIQWLRGQNEVGGGWPYVYDCPRR